MIDQLNHWSAVWAHAMGNIAWQSALLAVAVVAICWLLRHESPGLRYFLWLALSLKLLLLPLWSVQLAAPAWLNAPARAEPTLDRTPISGLVASATSQPTVTLPTPTIAQQPLTESSINLPPASLWQSLSSLTLAAWLLLLWATVILIALARIVWQFRSLRRLLATTAGAGEAERIVVEQCAARLGLKRLPTVRVAEGEGSPMVCGVRRTTLVLPAALVEEIDRPALRQIVLHELAHLQRRDLLTVWAIHLMRTVYWFNPVAHWIAYRAGLERELACDRLAMVNSGVSVATYAHTLIDAAGRKTQPLVLNAAVTARLTG